MDVWRLHKVFVGIKDTVDLLRSSCEMPYGFKHLYILARDNWVW